MERKGSGMGKIINPIKALPYFEEKMLPTFFSDRAQFTVTFPNMNLSLAESHPDIEVNFVWKTKVILKVILKAILKVILKVAPKMALKAMT